MISICLLFENKKNKYQVLNEFGDSSTVREETHKNLPVVSKKFDEETDEQTK
jgi:hypothetical protein